MKVLIIKFDVVALGLELRFPLFDVLVAIADSELNVLRVGAQFLLLRFVGDNLVQLFHLLLLVLLLVHALLNVGWLHSERNRLSSNRLNGA